MKNAKVKITMKKKTCGKHPQYQGIHPPRVNCKKCKDIWSRVTKDKIETLMMSLGLKPVKEVIYAPSKR